MIFFKILRVWLVFFVVVFSLQGNAYQVQELSLEDKVRGSDMVAIGTVISVLKTFNEKAYSTAIVEIKNTLKGKAVATISFGFDGMTGEINPECCVKGRTYLFFLEKSEGGDYFSFNPPYGVYPMDP